MRFRSTLQHGTRHRLTGMLGVLMLAVGCGLAALGFALVLDVLSLRELLAQYGPRPIGQLAIVVRAQMHHPGAQVGELLAGLTGLLLAGCGARGLSLLRRASVSRKAGLP
ncbi:MAG: hypothetical protein AB7K36_02225 [Chloroflexota bacterium]